jgi:hypothetical protein
MWNNATIKFGQISGSSTISADISGVRNLYIDNNAAIRFYDTSDYPINVMTFNSNNLFAFGYGVMTTSSLASRRKSLFQGGEIELQVGYKDSNEQIQATTAFRISRETINGEGVEGICHVYNGLCIGNALLRWDSTNNALYVTKSDGTTANFYTTGGVSALGFQSGGVSSLDAFTINTLTTSSIANGSGNVKMGNICSNTPASGTPNWKILTTGAATFKGVTATSVSATGVTVSGANGTVSAAYVQGTYFRFSDDSYIYKDPITHKLMYQDENGNNHEVSFVS